VNPKQIERFQKSLLKWGSSNCRAFIWRAPHASAYVIVISEMLLRKTRADSVDRIARELLKEYPSFHKLSRANGRHLSALLRPLGLHRTRARALIVVAKRLLSDHHGEVPRDYDYILSLPHIGRYGANSVLSVLYGERRPIVDSNIVRLFSRAFGTQIPREVHKADYLWSLAASLLPDHSVKQFNWALLDLSALLCKPRNPDHDECPIKNLCLTYRAMIESE
jgi:A/G-specific adenine glycosylase